MFRLSFFVLSLASFCSAATDQNGYAGSGDVRRLPSCDIRFASKDSDGEHLAWGCRFSLSQIDEGSALHYAVHREGEHLEFSVTRNGKETRSANVRAMVGGKRHGLSFLIEMDQIDGMPLARRALLEGRYASSRLGTLILSPGFLKATPGDEEDTLGRVLSPTFEQRCLTCHGQPNTLGAGSQGGVRCESCHGPSAAHVNSLKSGSKDSRMVMPSTLKDERGITICTQCHNGLTTATHSDPMPEDLLVSNQIPASKDLNASSKAEGSSLAPLVTTRTKIQRRLFRHLSASAYAVIRSQLQNMLRFAR